MMEAVPEPPAEVPKIEDNYEEILQQLRREWKWAAASDFLHKFNPMLHLDFLDLADVEHDLIRGTSGTIMTVFVKILHVLTSIRGLAPDTWETYLRRLYARRVPENRVWGSEEEPIVWAELSWIDRLGILHDLCEWQFQNPLRVRQTMKDDSDDAAWRSAPIGRDSMRNEYWHLGRDRLWIQRSVVKPEPPKDLKRKRHPTKGSQQPAKRKAPQKGARKSTSSHNKTKSRESQPKPSKAREKSSKNVNGARLGSRTSRRGGIDGWQKVPDEWLKQPSASPEPQKGKNNLDKKDVEALFDASDLTDLSDNDKPQDIKAKGKTIATSDSTSELTDMDEDGDAEDEDERQASTESSEDVQMDVDPRDDANFVEFETICVTINEWREFAEKFKNVKSHNERRLYRYITLVAIPKIEEHQQAIEEKEKRELKEMLKREQAAAAAAAAESRPKRSTRLAALADEDEKKNESSSMDGDSDARWGVRSTRTRRATVRGTRWMEEQEEQLAALEASEADDGDEQGRAEDVDRQTNGRNKSDQDEYQDEDSEDAQPPSTPNTVEINTRGRPRRAAAVKADLMRPVKPTRKRRVRSDSEDGFESDEPFFLQCEICKKSGWNEDDGQHLISCKECNIWQHMTCHDRADKLEGRPKRNWSEEQFLCASCTLKAQNKRPRRGRKPKETATADVGDAQMDIPATSMVDSVAMDISQPLNQALQRDPTPPPIEHATTEQSAPLLHAFVPAQVPNFPQTSQPSPINGAHITEQYSETLAQAQQILTSGALSSPPPVPKQPVIPNPPAPQQYSEQLALAQKIVASGHPLPVPEPQVVYSTQPNSYPQMHPNEWPTPVYPAQFNGAPMNAMSYAMPPPQVAPQDYIPPPNGGGQFYPSASDHQPPTYSHPNAPPS